MKNILVVIAVLALLGIGGYFYLSSRGMIPKGTTMMGQNNGGNVFSSIKDALSKSLSLKCVYTDESGVETTSYIKGGAVRVMMTGGAVADQPNNIIIKDSQMHMWNDSTKTGLTYKIEPSDSEPTAQDTMEKKEGAEAGDKESVLAQIEKYKDACKAEVVADSYFVVPTDVTFEDLQMMQNKMMKDLPPAPDDPESAQQYQDYLNQMMQGQGQ